PDGEAPDGLDWEMWLGPAPHHAFNANRFGVADRWSTFRYFYDYANGWIGDWGVHLVDIVQWAMGVPGPHTVGAAGSRFVIRDNSEVPDTLQVTFEYPDFLCTYENRLANWNSRIGKGHGIEFHGTEATMLLDRSGFEVFPEKRKLDDGTEVARTVSMKMEKVDDGLYNHVGNMLECMKTRQRPVSDIEEGHRSSATCLLGNIALRTRERIAFDAVKQEMRQPSPAAKTLFGREYRAPWKLSV
ncbi:MAG TPA: Gfo/Idh/MocA family oxidoreductase, partial [Vicinamibacteria bacterium]|nr:Gfo/Idh/MocA family oxidoreductase [Vicinamibacteria bacterium]